MRLFRRGRGRMEDLELHDVPGTGDNEIHEHVTVDGSTGFLRTPLRHDDYRGLDGLARPPQPVRDVGGAPVPQVPP